MSRKSSGIVILYRGRIMAERHQDLQPKSARYRRVVQGRSRSEHVIEDVASVQKSVVSFLVGVAREKGLIKIGDPVHRHLGVGWSKAKPEQEKVITIRHLITMSSGLNNRLEFVARPGTVWKYNTTAYSASLRAIAAASDKSPNELTSEWLTDHIGMKDSRWVARLAMTPFQIRSFRAHRASREDAGWLRDTLSREGRALGTGVELQAETSLTLRWRREHPVAARG